MRNLPGNLLGDLASLPAHVTNRERRPVLLLGLTAVAAGPLYLDETLRDLVQPPSENVRDILIRPFTLDRTDLTIGLHSGAIGVLGTAWIVGSEDMARWGAALFETVLLVDMIVLPLKVITGRKRPHSGEADDFSLPGSVYDAFPSGHTAWSTAIASMVSRSSAPSWSKALLWIGSAGIALQRILSDEHWTSDVLIGALLGTWAGCRVAARYWSRDTDGPGDHQRAAGVERAQRKQCSVALVQRAGTCGVQLSIWINFNN